MKSPRDPNLPRQPAPLPPEGDTSDLVDLKAIAASTRASAVAPVVSAAELSGVVARRDSVVGARVTDGSGGVPPWIFGVLGCLGVMALGLGVFWYLNAPVRQPSLADAPVDPAAGHSPSVHPANLGPEIVPLPSRAEPAPVEPAHTDKEKAAAHHAAVGKTTAHAAAAAAAVHDEEADTVPEAPKKPTALDSLLSSAIDGPGSSDADKRDPRAAAGSAAVDPERARKDVDAALDELQPKVHECFRRFQIRGIATVKMTVSPSGTVESPALTGDFEGTPTGECVIKELASAALPPFKGGPVNVSHAYVFR